MHDFRSFGNSDELSQPGSMKYKSSQEGEDIPEGGEAPEERVSSNADEGAQDLENNQVDLALVDANEMEEDNGRVGPLPSFKREKSRYKNKSRHQSLEFNRKEIGKILSMETEDSAGPSGFHQPNLGSQTMLSSGGSTPWEGGHQSQMSYGGLHSQTGSHNHSRRETGNDNFWIHSRNESNYVHFGGHSRQESIYSAVESDLDASNEEYGSRKIIAELRYQLNEANTNDQFSREAIEDLQEWIRATGKPAVLRVNSLEQEYEAMIKDYESRIKSLTDQIKEKNHKINKLEVEKEQWEKTNQVLRDQLNEMHKQQLNDDNMALRNAKGEAQESVEQLRRERLVSANMREKFTEQTTRMGKMSAMISQLQLENKNLNQEIQTYNAQRKIHERDAMEWKDQNQKAREHITSLRKKLEQQRVEHQQELQSLSLTQKPPALQNLTSNDLPNFENMPSGPDTVGTVGPNISSTLSRDSVVTGNLKLVLQDRDTRHHRTRSNSVHSIHSDRGGHRRVPSHHSDGPVHSRRHSRNNSLSSLTKTRSRRGKTLSQKQLMRDIAELKKTILPQRETQEDMCKTLSRQVLREVQRSLETFVQEELVDVVKDVFSDNPAMNPRLKGCVSPSKEKIKSGVKDLAKEVFKEETENFKETLQRFEELCSKIDKDMLNSLSLTNNKLVDSLSASRKWFASFKSHIESVTNSHMNEVKDAISEVGANPGDIKFDTKILGEMVRESTIELLKKNLEIGLKNATSTGTDKVKTQQDQQKLENLEEEIRKLSKENESLNTSLMQAGRDKLLAMSRLNEEIEKLRTYVRQLKSRSFANSGMNHHGGAYHSGYESQEYTQSPRDSIISWAWT